MVVVGSPKVSNSNLFVSVECREREREREASHGDITPHRSAAHNLPRSAQSLLWPLSQPGLKVVDLCLVYSLQELGAELQVISDFQ